MLHKIDMKKLNTFFKDNKKIFFVLVFTILLGFYVCGFAVKQVLNISVFAENLSELNVYTIYHVETFEGGGKSRIEYLKMVANEIEKAHSGTLFIIKKIDAEKLSIELENEIPDLISFGFGVGKIVLPYLKQFEHGYSVRDELIESGSFNNKLFAIPYIMSGYSLITNGESINNFYCGNNKYLKLNNLEISNKTTNFEENSYEAYKKFVNSKNSALLGTARDVFRVQNLISLGRIDANITPISEYTDLMQYIGVCKISVISNEFVSKLLETGNQIKLTDYSLFSSLYNKIYTKDIYSDMEDAILSCKIPNLYE